MRTCARKVRRFGRGWQHAGGPRPITRHPSRKLALPLPLPPRGHEVEVTLFKALLHSLRPSVPLARRARAGSPPLAYYRRFAPVSPPHHHHPPSVRAAGLALSSDRAVKHLTPRLGFMHACSVLLRHIVLL
jgi:hypothetical protein